LDGWFVRGESSLQECIDAKSDDQAKSDLKVDSLSQEVSAACDSTRREEDLEYFSIPTSSPHTCLYIQLQSI
jgi:hypothetical protein